MYDAPVFSNAAGGQAGTGWSHRRYREAESSQRALPRRIVARLGLGRSIYIIIINIIMIIITVV